MTLSLSTARLLDRFRAQRPLRGGSLIVTVFGDALAPRGATITLGSLIPLVAPFGLTDRLVRTSVGRLAIDGWLTAHRHGRLSEYCLSETGAHRFAEATRRIYGGPLEQARDRWTLVVLPPAESGVRTRLRDVLRLDGFGELDPGVFAHPRITPVEATDYLAGHGIDDALLFDSELIAGADPASLVARAWDLSTLADRYRRFCDAFAPIAAGLQESASVTPELAFIIRTLLVHEYRRIHLRDPLLPSALLPAHWPGTAAFTLCRTVYSAVLGAAEDHLSTNAHRLDSPLPPPSADLWERFPAPPHR
jgi:phenylacetic acid degradation operon negative regulatory protein